MCVVKPRQVTFPITVRFLDSDLSATVWASIEVLQLNLSTFPVDEPSKQSLVNDWFYFVRAVETCDERIVFQNRAVNIDKFGHIKEECLSVVITYSVANFLDLACNVFEGNVRRSEVCYLVKQLCAVAGVDYRVQR